MNEKRADIVLCEQRLAESRTKAAALIKDGCVMQNGKAVTKPSQLVDADIPLLLSGAPTEVSRAGLKLRAALEAFKPEIKGLTFADIGASTGGFTQCLLEEGARRVYAVDVGTSQLHASLLDDSRVVNMEQTNARFLTADSFPEQIDGAVMDVSFISQTLIYPALASFLPSGAVLITLIKPQFEVGRENIGKKGIVKDRKGTLRDMVFLKLRLAAEDNGFTAKQFIDSPIKGGSGNTEYLGLFYKD